MSNVTKSEGFIDECIVNLVTKLNEEYAAKAERFAVFSWMHFCQLYTSTFSAVDMQLISFRQSLTILL